jgi:hypothetical protein
MLMLLLHAVKEFSCNNQQPPIYLRLAKAASSNFSKSPAGLLQIQLRSPYDGPLATVDEACFGQQDNSALPSTSHIADAQAAGSEVAEISLAPAVTSSLFPIKRPAALLNSK